MNKFDCPYLKFDEACVNTTANDNNYWLYSLSTECISCPYMRIIQMSKNNSLKFSTVKPIKWRVLDNDGKDEYVSAKDTSNIVCQLSPDLGQYGLYELTVHDNQRVCNLKTFKSPTNPYTELFVISGVILFTLLAIATGKSLWHIFKNRYVKNKTEQQEISNKNKPRNRRVKAIDAFRGAVTLFMIFVNDDSGGYSSILGHATWNGILPGDVVFPSFIWIMGVCIPIVVSIQLKRGLSKLQLSYSILKRSILLFLIGISLNTLGTNAQLENIRILGVLQRISITYLAVGLLYLCFTSHEQTAQNVSKSWIIRGTRDMLKLWPQWCIMLTLVIIHSILTFSLSVPGCPVGYLGPGGKHEDGKYFNCTGGTAGYIDRIILTLNHIYQRPTIDSIYQSGPFDPEGILGCLTAIFQVFLGVHAGIILIIYKDWKQRVIRWLLWAVFYGCLGSVLHLIDVIPINKNLWSLSFVFVSSAFSLVFLSICYLLIDVTTVWQGGPFRIPGMNALLLYVGHSVCFQIFPFHWRIGMMDSRALCLIESIWVVILWTIIAYVMHNKRIYITL